MTSTTADRDELSRVTEIVRASYPAMRGIATASVLMLHVSPEE